MPLYLDSLDLSHVRQGYGTPGINRSVSGKPLRIGGRALDRGVGTHAWSEIHLELRGDVKAFRAEVGIVEDVGKQGSVAFHVWGDGRLLADSGICRGGESPRPLQADLRGLRRLVLVCADGGDGIDMDHGAWADARFEAAEGAAIVPAPPPDDFDPPAVAPFDPEQPALHAPRAIGLGPGKPFLFRIPATGPAGRRFVASGLPEGLRLDPATGIISGSCAEIGNYPVLLEMEAGGARFSQHARLVCGHDTLALTPPMGWNSWNCWGLNVTQHAIEEAAAAMIESRLADFGYNYVNIDDGWADIRPAEGNARPNRKFPDMEALVQRIHGRGLRAGIYSSPGRYTCGGQDGSLNYEMADAMAFARWGFDYLKYDYCSYIKIAGWEASREEQWFPYRRMAAALSVQPRDIIYSACTGGAFDPWDWAPGLGAHLWRTTTDVFDTWGSVTANTDRHSRIAGAQRPGRWNDPDMLVAGPVGWGGAQRPPRLTLREQQAHMTLWAILGAPLLIGCNMRGLGPEYLALLANPEVIAIDQDPLGQSGRLLRREGYAEVWVRPLEGGDSAVAVINRGPHAAAVAVALAQAGQKGACAVRDAWQRRELGTESQQLKLECAPHGGVLLRLTPVTV